MFKYWLTAAGASLLLAGPAVGADVAAGEQIVMQGNGKGALACVSCHGAQGAGNAAAGFPRLAGLDAEHMVKQLQDYKAGTRKNPVMAPFAAALTDEEMANVSAYYAAQQAPVTAAKPEGEAAALGERLTLIGNWDKDVPACVACHGPGARGVGKSFPALAGQHAAYIKAQFQAWKNGQRTNDPDELMKVVAERLSDEEIEAVANYLASLEARR
ncbi:cytochrome c4 [Ectothiorhodospiraceae bacterium 2226]|nr:cytochrome c4 [Ectothiorhodospiraceae bacterium 2226]